MASIETENGQETNMKIAAACRHELHKCSLLLCKFKARTLIYQGITSLKQNKILITCINARSII